MYKLVSFQNNLPIFFLMCVFSFAQTSYAEPIKVEIKLQDGDYDIYRGGELYEVKGVGLTQYDFARVARYGANSIRTWSVDSNSLPTMQILDEAHANGLTVSLCLEFGKERYGFDFSDQDAIEKLLLETRERVERFKDHPALLTWIIGNEVNLNYTDPRVFDVVNQAAEMIKQIDPNHPTTTALAGFDTKAIDDLLERAPALDFVSFQMYGDLINLPKYIADYGFSKPYMVTEWGSIGHWEVGKTKWDAPIENTSSEKAANYARSYVEVIEPFGDTLIGNYVFLWGQKQERTPTWYGMFLDSGEKTEAVDVMRYIWTDKWSDNRAPRISPILLDSKRAFENIELNANQQYTASIEIIEYEQDTVSLKWELRAESTAQEVGGDAEYVPPIIAGSILKSDETKAIIKAPEQAGAYRLFVYAYDNQGNAAHANIPFYVIE